MVFRRRRIGTGYPQLPFGRKPAQAPARIHDGRSRAADLAVRRTAACRAARARPRERSSPIPRPRRPTRSKRSWRFVSLPVSLPRFAALRFVACAGAGVDEVLATPDLARARADRARRRSAPGRAHGAVRRADGIAPLSRAAAPRGAAARRALDPPASRVGGGLPRRRDGLRLDRRAGRRCTVASRLSRCRMDADPARDRGRRVVRRGGRAASFPRAEPDPRLHAAAHRARRAGSSMRRRSLRCRAAPT